MLKVNDILRWSKAQVVAEGDVGCFKGVEVDSRRNVEGKLFFALRGEKRDGHNFIPEAVTKGAKGVVCERAEFSVERPVWVFKVQDTLYALGNIAGGYRRKKNFEVMGITGSVGKTTTKEFIWALLKHRGWTKSPGNYNNLIGVPLSLFGVGDETGVVLEMAINTKGEMRRLCEIAKPNYALITRIGESHLEGLGSLDEVEREKGIIYESVDSSGVIFINVDDARVLRASEHSPARKIYYSMKDERADVFGRVKRTGEDKIEIEVVWRNGVYPFKVPFIVEDYVLNVLSALSVGFYFNIPYEVMRKEVENFKPLAGRMEVVKRKGFIFINDAYNANPLSFNTALKVASRFPGRKILVVGDMLELGDYSESAHRKLGRKIGEYSFEVVFYKGEMGEIVKAGIEEINQSIHFEKFDSLSAITEALKRVLRKGDVVLFKASHRVGIEDVFKKVIEETGGEDAS